MQMPLTCADYERMTYNAVAAKYPEKDEPQGSNRALYMAMTMHQWDAVKRNGYTANTKDAVFRKHMLKQVYELESDVVSTRRPLAHMIRDEPKTYRISFNQKGGVEVTCFDLENIDSELEGHYDSVSALPTWVQERVAVLAVCSPNPPTPTVEGIGRRISENVYWLYK